MNPYLSAGLAMCAVIFVALIGTTYLAVFFNRRAKADLQLQLEPLAAFIDGDVDIEKAEVTGTFEGTIAQGRVTGAEGGAGRVFQTEIVDAAGGERWRYRSIAHRDRPEPTDEFDSARPELRDLLADCFTMDWLETIAVPSKHWFWVEYDPAAGFVRLILPMQVRRDVPKADAFERQLTYLRMVGNRNREVQGAS